MKNMSLYNLIRGPINIACKILIPMIGLSDDDFPRFRDVSPCDPNEDEGARLVVLTRTGGGNREEYADENDRLTQNPYYVYDKDSAFDCTYAEFYFRIPDEWLPDYNAIVEGLWENVSEKFVSLIEKYQPQYVDGLRQQMVQRKM